MKATFSMLILLITISYTYAQTENKMMVLEQAERRPDQLIDQSRVDRSGRLCAGLLILTDLSELRFESSLGVVNMTYEPGRYMVFISAEERALSVYKEGFSPLEIILNDYGIYGLKSGEVYQLEITAVDEDSDEALPVFFYVTPEDADIRVNDLSVTAGVPLALSVGQAEVVIEKEGYYTIQETVRINRNNYLFDYKMRWIPILVRVNGGTFSMGSNSGGNSERPVHRVTVADYYIGNYPVTQKEWTEVMGSNPSRFVGSSLPVENISWYDAVEFCNMLSIRDSLTQVYRIQKSYPDPNNTCIYDDAKWVVSVNWNADGYRLPTEAEWEFAARGGRLSRNYAYSGGEAIDEVGWYRDNSARSTHSVGQKKANELGVYDMSGNVWEWCWDWFIDYNSSAKVNPRSSEGGCCKICRGGSWGNNIDSCTVFKRHDLPANSRNDYTGFRIARNAD